MGSTHHKLNVFEGFMSDTIQDIHTRLGVIEKDTRKILALVERMHWIKWHIRALWAALLAMFGLKGV